MEEDVSPPNAAEPLIRRIRPSDAPALEAFYAALSGESRRTRFFSVAAGPSHARAVAFCAPDHDHAEGFVAVLSVAAGGGERIIGHLCLEPAGGHTAEVAIAVADDVRRHGIGRRLLDAGLRWALAEGFTTLAATAWIENVAIHRLLAGVGYPTRTGDADAGIEDIRLDLRVPRAAA